MGENALGLFARQSGLSPYQRKPASLLYRKLPDEPQIEFSLRSPSTHALRNLGPELLVNAESPLGEFIGFHCIGQPCIFVMIFLSCFSYD